MLDPQEQRFEQVNSRAGNYDRAESESRRQISSNLIEARVPAGKAIHVLLDNYADIVVIQQTLSANSCRGSPWPEDSAYVEAVMDDGTQPTRDGVVALSPGPLAFLLEGIEWRNPQASWRPRSAG
jgi:hypothetical protein